MKSTFHELIRELRWLAYSRTALVLALVGAGVALTGMLSASSSTLAAISAFEDTLARYRENGEDVGAALSAPAEVEGDAGHQVISNALRFDLDQAALALTQLDAVGAICAVLSLCALLVFPIVGFVLGVFLSTHDVRSGSVILRWPQGGITAFAAAKPLTLVASLAALAGLVSLLTIPCAWVATEALAHESAAIEAFAVDPPPAAQAVGIAVLAVLTGTAFGSLGLLVGSVTRNRTFSVGAFVVGFLLIPLLGVGDPRNFITLAGADVLYFVGQFRPAPLGELPTAAAAWALLTGSLLAVGLSLIPWMTRRRTAGRA